MRFILTLMTIVVLLTPAWAQSGAACTTATTHGTYSVVCSGFISTAADAPPVPFSAIALVKGDWAGYFSGGGKASIGGNIVDQTVKGMVNINSDCTGTVTYDQKIAGQPAPKLNLTYQVLDDGKEIRAVSTDPGATYSCNLRLMSR